MNFQLHFPVISPPFYMNAKRESLLAYFCLAGVSLIWGTTYLAIRIGVADFPPFLFAGIRQITAGILLAGFMFLFFRQRIAQVQWLPQMAGGFLMITMGNGLVSWAEVYVPSGVASIICSLMPALVVVINLFADRTEMPNGFIFTGLLIGMGGILLVFSEYLAAFANGYYTMGIVFIFLATLSWALGSVLIKKRGRGSNPFLNAGLQMFFGGIFCLPVSLVFDNYSNFSWNTDAIYSLVYLSLMGSVAAFAMYSYALTRLPITIASLYSYINPLVAVLLGWLLAQEMLNIKIALAFFITIAGIYLVSYGHQQRKKNLPLALDPDKAIPL